jgi:hypothetical protein
MMTLLELTPGLLALSLAASLVACTNDNAAPAEADAAPQGKVVANDCRSPNSQSTQRGCRPTTRTLGSL